MTLAPLTGSSDPYGTLGVSRSAGNAEIRRAYKKLAKEW
ncbi:MAG: DnaJ domain-containing protein [Acidobacteriota bacterium]